MNTTFTFANSAKVLRQIFEAVCRRNKVQTTHELTTAALYKWMPDNQTWYEKPPTEHPFHALLPDHKMGDYFVYKAIAWLGDYFREIKAEISLEEEGGSWSLRVSDENERDRGIYKAQQTLPTEIKEDWQRKGLLVEKSPPSNENVLVALVGLMYPIKRARYDREITKLYQENPELVGSVTAALEGMTDDILMERGISEMTEQIGIIHKRCEKFRKHPLIPIVEAYFEDWHQKQANTKGIERRGKQIAPSFVKESRIITGNQLPTGFLHTQGTKTPQLYLPTFETVPDDIIVHALPIEIYKGEGGGHGAPLDERIFFNALLARPYGKAEPFNAIRLEPTLGDYVDWLYPNGWNRTNQLPLLQKALEKVHNKRISYQRRGWNVVQVLAMPEKTTKMTDALPLIIRYPDGVQDNGPMIDVERMRQYGLVSASKWRAWIRLHYLWDTARQRNGGYTIYTTIPKVKRNDEGYLLNTKGELILSGNPCKNKKGRWSVRRGNQPQKDWFHPQAIRIGEERNPMRKKIPVLTDKRLVALFYNDSLVDDNTFWKRLHDARSAATDMESDGVIVIERDAIDKKMGTKGWRIIPVFQDKIT